MGNPFHDQHELHTPWEMYIYDFVTLPLTDAHDVAVAIEQVCPDLTVFARPLPGKRRILSEGRFELTQRLDAGVGRAGWAGGSVWTSVRPDGSLYVALGLYAQACVDPLCNAGHAASGIQIRPSAPLTKAERQRIVDCIGESDDWPLGAGYDVEVLTGLGFLPVDAPLSGIEVTDRDVYRALGVLLRADKRTWLFKLRQMDEAGFEVELDRLGPAAYAAVRELGVRMKPEYEEVA